MGLLFECECSNSNGYSILQWNTLSNKLSTKQIFPNVDENYLKWENRKKLIKEILKKENPDILILDEIDNFNNFKKEIIDALKIKYTGNFYERLDKYMGIYIGINPNKFLLIEQKKIKFHGNDNELTENKNKFESLSPQIFIVSTIEEIKTKETFYLIVSHLKAKKENENIRLIQINEILQYIKDNGLNNQNIILVGDFNAEPQNESIINLEKFGMKSVFDYNKLEYTSFQVRDGIDKKILDYIFYYGNLIFAEEKKSDIKIDENIGLPNEQFPSNHLYLKAMFKIN